MQVSEAQKIIQALADGVDPTTGEEFPLDSPYQNPQVIRALFTSLRLLEKNVQRQNRDKGLPSNAGKPWDNGEDQKLCDGFDAGMSIAQLSQKHERTYGSIQSRLVKLGKIQAPPSSP